jgi:broad specificity phosphatase PhoE
MLTFYIARHGQNVDNEKGILNGHRDEPLTEKGIAQAQELSQSIKQNNLIFDHIFSSPLSRAFKTAEIVAKSGAGPRPVVMPELIERDFGVMTGIEQSRIAELCAPEIIQTNTITYFLSPEGAETFPDLLIRANKVLADLEKRFSDGRILLVTHGDFGKMLYAAYYKLDWKDVLLQFHFGNSELLLLSQDSSPEDYHIVKIEQFNH